MMHAIIGVPIYGVDQMKKLMTLTALLGVLSYGIMALAAIPFPFPSNPCNEFCDSWYNNCLNNGNHPDYCYNARYLCIRDCT